MEKGLATLVFPFCYLVSPLIAWANEESIDKTNERIWLRLNGYSGWNY